MGCFNSGEEIDVSESAEKTATGWNWIVGSRKWHWFGQDGVSLCRKWMIFSNADAQEGNDESVDNCTACKRLLKRRRATIA